jgi:predicted neuraminidase
MAYYLFALTMPADGMLHIAFTYFRQAIKYVRVEKSWITHR